MDELIGCATCGSRIARSAKRCPACGGRNKPPRKPWSIASIAVVAVIAVVIAIAYESKRSERDAEMRRCVEWGASYFREIDSYPRLSDGRLAEDVARERCGRTLDAFPDPGRPE